MFDELQKFPAGTTVKFLHKKVGESEKFVFILDESRYAMVKHDGHCYIKINQAIQHVSDAVFRETVDLLLSNRVLVS